MTQRKLLMILFALAGAALVLCMFFAGIGLLLLNQPGRPAMATVLFQSPTPLLQVTQTSPFQQASPGTPVNEQPKSTFEPLAETATAQPISASPVVPGSLQGKIVFPHRFNQLNALYQIDLANNSSPEMLLGIASDLLLTAPALSPDGTKVAFNYLRGGMYVLNIGSDEPARLSSCGAPSWSPDGTQVICKSNAQASFDILDVITGMPVRSLSAEPSALFPTWSPKGDEIVFNMRDRAGNTSIWRQSLADENSRVMLVGEASENYAPAWSPDGQWIAFQSNQDSQLSDIWVVDRDGGNLRRVVNTPEGFWSRAPAWSPDGQWLAFVSDQAGSIGQDYGEIFVVSLVTGEVRQVTQTGGRVYDWRISWGR